MDRKPKIDKEILDQLKAELEPAFRELAELSDAFHENRLEAVLLSTQRFAVLNESGEVVGAKNVTEWANFMNSPQREIGLDKFGEFMVSTIFLGLNHQFNPEAPPLWFETMVFGPAKETELFGKKALIHPDLWQSRASTRAEALAMHREGIAWLKESYLQSQ
jgi:hypothetical protein